jgi:phage terminase large subunit
LSVLRIPTAEVFEPLLYPARYKGAHGGRGSGKSHFFATLALEDAITAARDIVCVREIQRTLDQSVKKLLEQKIAEHNLGGYFEIQDRKIITRPVTGGQGVIIFEGMQDHNADSIKSLEGYDRAWVEEAQSLSQRSLDLLRPTIRKPGSELWFGWNPRHETDPVDVLLRGENPPPEARVVRANYLDNPWLPQVLKDEIAYDQGRDPDKFAHVWLGGYQKNSEARVFRNWKVEEFATPRGATFRLGADWGFAVDPSVLVRCYLEGRTLFVDHEAYMVGCEIDQLPDLFRTVPESEKWFITADSARPETISYMQRHGFPRLTAAIKGPRSLEEGVEFLKSFDIVVHPRCRHVIDELANYSYEVDKLTGVVLPRLADRDNHTIDALRYACEGLRRSGKVINRPIVHKEPRDWMSA